MNFKIPFMWFLLRPSPAHVQLKNCKAILARFEIDVGLGRQCRHWSMYAVSKPGRDARYVLILLLILFSKSFVWLFVRPFSCSLPPGVSTSQRSIWWFRPVCELVLSPVCVGIGVVYLSLCK
jgi:hypothetical protein